MKPTLRSLFAAVSLAISARADWLVSDYSTVTSDSAQTRAVYGIQTYQNRSSSVTTSVPGGYVQLDAPLIASDGTEGYTVDIGLQQPLTPDWKTYDLTGLQAITFEYQNATKITDVLSVSFGSDAYSDAIVKAGTIYSNDIAGSVALSAGTTWKTAEIYLSDFATPAWWTDIPADFPTIEQVLKRVRNIQFSPKTLYTSSGTQNGVACVKCVGPTMTSQTLKIRNIRLMGVDTLSLSSDPPRPAFRKIRSFAGLTIPVGASQIGYRFADYFQGATAYGVRNLGPARTVATRTTADSLYLDFGGMIAGTVDMIEVRATLGATSLFDTIFVTCVKPVVPDLGWLLSKYQTVTVDSGRTRAIYGIQTYQNKSSSVTTSVPGGYVQLEASKIASEGTEGYSVDLGLQHPITPDGKTYDLTGLTAITFEYQNATKITDVLSVRFGSDAYSNEIVKMGTVYSNDLAGSVMLAAGTTWKTAELLLLDFATPAWWTDIPADYPTIDDVVKRVKSIEFSPRTLYTSSGTQNGIACTKCVGPTMTSQTLKIRNVRLVGISSLRPVPVDPAFPFAPTLREPRDGTKGLPSSVTLRWNRVAGAKTYLVQVDTSMEFAAPKQIRVGGAGSSASINLSKGKNYVWRVQAKSARGVSDWSPVWSFQTSRSIKPSRGHGFGGWSWRKGGRHLTMPVPEGVQSAVLEIRDLEGRLVQSSNAHLEPDGASWSVGNLRGTYMAQVRSEFGILESSLLVVP